MSSGYFQARWHPDDPNVWDSNQWVDVLTLSMRDAASQFVQYEFDRWGKGNEADFTEVSMCVQVRRPGSDAISDYFVTGETEVVFTAKFKESTQ